MTFSTGAERMPAYTGRRRVIASVPAVPAVAPEQGPAGPPKGEAAMKACFRSCLAVLAAAVLAACATTTEHQPRLTPSTEIKIRDNDEYISAVERAARKKGVGVIWVNPPQVRDED
jgi:hypothetical protein